MTLQQREDDQMRVESLSTGTSQQQSAVEYLDYVVKASQGLTEILTSVRKAIQTIEQKKKEIKSIVQENKDGNPELTNETSTIEDFQSYFRDAKHFQEGCQVLASYAVKETTTEAIDHDLGQGRLTELTDYVKLLVKRLKECQSCLRTLCSSQDRAREKAQSNADKYNDKETSYKENAQKAEMEAAAADRSTNIAAMAAITTLSGASIGSLFVKTTRTANWLWAGGLVLAVAALVWGGNQQGGHLKEEKVASNRKQQNVYKIMQKNVNEILSSFREVIEKAEEMWRQEEQARNELNRENTTGIVNYSTELSENIPMSVAQREDIQQTLEQLRHTMQSMLQELDPLSTSTNLE